MADVVKFPGLTVNDVPPDRVLEGAIGRLTGVVLVGRDDRGELYIASSYGHIEQTYLLLAIGQKDILARAED